MPRIVKTPGGLWIPELASTPGNPDAESGALYAKSDGELYYLTNAGVEHKLTPPSAGGGGGATGGIIRKTANQVMTLTAQTAINDMAFAVAANSSYVFLMNIQVTTSTGTSPTTAYGFTGPSLSTFTLISEQDTSTSVEASGVLVAFTNLAAGAQVANTGARFFGTVQTGANAGTVQLTAARGGTSPSMNVAAGSNGFWLKVA